jgi:hypothetical protein
MNAISKSLDADCDESLRPIPLTAGQWASIRDSLVGLFPENAINVDAATGGRIEVFRITEERGGIETVAWVTPCANGEFAVVSGTAGENDDNLLPASIEGFYASLIDVLRAIRLFMIGETGLVGAPGGPSPCRPVAASDWRGLLQPMKPRRSQASLRKSMLAAFTGDA